MADEAESTAVVKRDEDGAMPPAPLNVDDTHGMSFFPSKSELSVILTLAATAVKAGEGFVPKGVTNAHQAAGIMLAGRELGVRPFTALRHIYPVNGKFELETRLMMGVCKSKDPSIKFIPTEYTRKRVAIILERGGARYPEIEYTLEDAKASGQYPETINEKTRYLPWVRYTRDMLYAAAGKRVCRLYCPDLINSIDAGLDNVTMFIEGEATAVRVIEPEDAEQVLANDAAAELMNNGAARNEGDDGTTPPEVQAATTPVAPADAFNRETVTSEILALIKEGRETYSDADFSAWAGNIRKDFPEAFDPNGNTAFNQLTDEKLTDLRDRMKRDIRGEGPPV